MANYLQWSLAAEGYLVAETVQTGKKQSIKLPVAVEENTPNKDNLNFIRNKEIKSMAKKVTEAWRIVDEGVCNG
jgi:hypothetical protein